MHRPVRRLLRRGLGTLLDQEGTDQRTYLTCKKSCRSSCCISTLRELTLLLQVNAQPRASQRGLRAVGHFMIDADGTIYQTLDLAERAFHAEQSNSTSVGSRAANRGRYNRADEPAARRIPHAARRIVDQRLPTMPTTSVPSSTTRSWRDPHLLASFPRSNPSSQKRTESLSEHAGRSGRVSRHRWSSARRPAETEWDPGALDWRWLTLPCRVSSFHPAARLQRGPPDPRRPASGAQGRFLQQPKSESAAFFPWHRAACGTPASTCGVCGAPLSRLRRAAVW